MSTFLDWFERHKYGIIGTLVLHTFLLFTLASVHMQREPEEDQISDLRLEMAPPMTEDEFKELEEQLQQGKEPTAFQEVKSMSSNVTAERTVLQNLDRSTQQRIQASVENELRRMEQAEFDRLAEQRRENGEEIVMPELDPSKWDPELYKEKASEPVKVEGATAVWHDLKDRAEQSIHIPAYLCKGQGRIVVKVRVDPAGKVVKADIDTRQSTTDQECMVENALRSARNARFSDSRTGTDQSGSIYYLFLPQ